MSGKATYEQLALRVKELEKEAAECKRAEEVLQESARQLRAAYDQAIKYADDLNQDITRTNIYENLHPDIQIPWKLEVAWQDTPFEWDDSPFTFTSTTYGSNTADATLGSSDPTYNGEPIQLDGNFAGHHVDLMPTLEDSRVDRVMQNSVKYLSLLTQHIEDAVGHHRVEQLAQHQPLWEW